MKKEAIEIIHRGLKCDNPECDWIDTTISPFDWEIYIDTPCPKCGHNVLTQEDYDKGMKFFQRANLIKAFHERTWVGRFMLWIEGLFGNKTHSISYDAHEDKYTINKEE